MTTSTVQVKSWVHGDTGTHDIEVEVPKDRQSIRIKGEILSYKPRLSFHEFNGSEMFQFDLTFKVGETIRGRAYDRGGWTGRILKIGKSKITLEGAYDRSQHISFADFIALNYYTGNLD